MKSVIFFSISLFLVFSWLWIAHAQAIDKDYWQGDAIQSMDKNCNLILQ